MRAGRATLIDNAPDHAARHLHHPLLLLRAFEQLPAHRIDGLALLVHDVVVFEQAFARFEVLRFHRLLRPAIRL